MTRSSFSFVKFYFTIIAIVSIVGMSIAFGIAIYQQGMHVLITDDEYISNRGTWEMQECESPTYITDSVKPIAVDGSQVQTTKEKTPEEIATCKEKVISRITNERRYQEKEAIIGGLTWGIIFLILFLTHYPRMVHEQDELDNSTSNSSTPSTKKIAKK